MDRFVGTAGWAIPRAHAHHFPREGSGLARYAAVLNAAEINSSFYRPHRPESWARWAAQVPPTFRFSVKMPRTITHEHELRGAAALVRQFLGDIAPLGGRLGALLVQLPPKLAFDARAAGRFFEQLRAWHDGNVACEPRHPTWRSAPADGLLRRFRIALVAADPPRGAAACEPGGWPGLAYYRMHGAPRPYFSPYSVGALAALARSIAESPAPAWCIFDNTGSGAAAANAIDLVEALASGDRQARPRMSDESSSGRTLRARDRAES